MATNLPKELIDALPKQFETESIAGTGGKGMPPEKRLILPPNAEAQYVSEGKGYMRGTGYQIPLQMPANYPKTDARGFPVPPLVANYDGEGKLTSISAKQRYWADNQYHILPEYSPTGEFLNANPATNEQAGSGGLGGFISDVAKDYGPMILAGLGANLAAGNFGSLFGGGAAAGSGALSPYAAQAAGAYGGSTAAASAAAAGNLAGIQTASAAQNALNLNIPTGGGLLQAPDQVAGMGANQISPLTPEATGSADRAALYGAEGYGVPASPTELAAYAGGTDTVSYLSSLTGLSPETIKNFAPSTIQGLLSAGGSYLQSEAAADAATTQAQAQVRAAQIAADANRFRPVGVTTRFSSSNFQTDAAGNVIGAGYTPSPEILGYQNRLSTLANKGLAGAEQAPTDYAPLTGAAQNLFSLGGSYIKKSPEEVAADYISKQQALLAPSQENQLAMLQNKLQQQGRGGLSVAQGGAMGATTPEMQAYYNSIAQSNLVLAAQADEEARRRISYGAGLFDTGANLQGRYYTGQTAALAPFTNPMDVTSGLESLAERPLTLGTSIGERTTAGAAQAGMLTGQGITSAANTMAPANAYSLGGNVLAGVAGSPNVTGALNRAFGVTQPTQQQYTFNPITGQYQPSVFT